MLTDRQREELHKAIADYLKQCSFDKTLEAFKSESNVVLSNEPKYNQLLEKKWITVLRLQKKNSELQKQLDSVKEEVVETSTSDGLNRRKDPTQWIPRPPAAQTLSGHRLPITACKFHPTYSVLITCSEDATIKLWDCESGEFERTLKGHTDSVNSIAFSKDGKLLASSSADMTIKLWDFTSGEYECVKTLHGHDHNVSCVRFLSGEKLISASRDKNIKIWDVQSGYCVATLSGHTDWIRRAIPSPCSKMVASCSNDKSILIWSLERKEIIQTLNDHEHVVEDVCWSIQSSDQYIYKAADLTAEKSAPSSNQPASSRFLASASRDKSIKFWDAQKGTHLFTFIGHDNWVRGLVFHPGGRYLISVADDKTIKCWDIENKRMHKQITDAHTHFVSSLDIHKKGNRVITGSVDMTVCIWDCR